MQNETILRPARISDAPKIATLIMQAMSDEVCRQYFYGDKHTADDLHQLLTALAEREDTQYSYANTVCAVDNTDNVIGACVSYDGSMLRQLRQPFIDGAKDAIGKDFSNMPEETEAGELYLDSIAVVPEYQGRGIAKMLLEATIKKAEDLGIGPVGLLVDCNNTNAERLYIKVGFRQIGVSNWGGHLMKHLRMPQ